METKTFIGKIKLQSLILKKDKLLCDENLSGNPI